jgi:hypothetical protein
MHKQGATLSDTSQAHQNLLEFYNAMGIGMFAGIIASGFSHLVFGAPAAIVMIFVYGISLIPGAWLEGVLRTFGDVGNRCCILCQPIEKVTAALAFGERTNRRNAK